MLLKKADAASERGAALPTAANQLFDEWKREGILLSQPTSLAPSSKGARFRKTGGRREWIDGPFAESKELVAGFSIIELASLAEAKKWAEAYAAILGDNEVDVRELAG